jgi:hypothetical protein
MGQPVFDQEGNYYFLMKVVFPTCIPTRQIMAWPWIILLHPSWMHQGIYGLAPGVEAYPNLMGCLLPISIPHMVFPITWCTVWPRTLMAIFG